ncbi:MAG TPA: class I SAM-dependent methyltransferase [Phycisphaerales bacterium]|nr:class I SAM-dependent methyltransferase [Phycisphaerales bacterium]HRQ75885.1 class I SAM-dependent methyltransferase [Phycisphaerales bacterium]
MNASPSIPIEIAPDAADDVRCRASALVARLGSMVIERGTSADLMRLAVDEHRVELLLPGMKPGRGVAADFTGVDVKPGRKQPLARAAGARTKTIIDATAGLGQDAFLLACLGYRVLAIERSPIVFALLEDGIRRAREDTRLSGAMGDRLTIMQGDAQQLIPQLDRADAIYIDPMFPPKRNVSALPRKEIQALRAAVGDDPDAANLLETALRHAIRRVIVKRPDHAPPLREGATTSHERKLVRYDVWASPGTFTTLREGKQ